MISNMTTKRALEVANEAAKQAQIDMPNSTHANAAKRYAEYATKQYAKGNDTEVFKAVIATKRAANNAAKNA